MKILITSANSRLPRMLAASLSGSHDVLLSDRPEVVTDEKITSCALGHDEATNDLVRGIDAIVHSAGVDPGEDASGQLDSAMRCTYNLLWAAAEEGMSRLVYLSSLRVMGKYDEDLAVTERWRPVPTTDASTLRYHMGEYVCREFAREKKLDVICLRLGQMIWDDAGSETVSSSALYPDDAVRAVERALAVEFSSGPWNPPSAWNVFHIQSAVPNARFLTGTAQESLGYDPRQRGCQ